MKWLPGIREFDNLDEREASLLARLGREFDQDPSKLIGKSKRPTARDFQLIGTLIQVYCFAELSARQIIELIDTATPDRQPDSASRLAPHDVFPKLAEAAERLHNTGKGNLKETITRAAGTVAMHRQIRHALAHWAVRRVEGGKAYLLLSKHSQEAKKRHGKFGGAEVMNYGIMGVATLRRELAKLEQHAQNLSMAAAAMSAEPEVLAKMTRSGPD